LNSFSTTNVNLNILCSALNTNQYTVCELMSHPSHMREMIYSKENVLTDVDEAHVNTAIDLIKCHKGELVTGLSPSEVSTLLTYVCNCAPAETFNCNICIFFSHSLVLLIYLFCLYVQL
jgi:hypothetical protein